MTENKIKISVEKYIVKKKNSKRQRITHINSLDGWKEEAKVLCIYKTIKIYNGEGCKHVGNDSDIVTTGSILALSKRASKIDIERMEKKNNNRTKKKI